MSRETWDDAAEHFDEEPDHGLTDARIRAAWSRLLRAVIPAPPVRVADLGCGTGSMTRLLADEGHSVDGLDFSPEMIRRAREKVPEATFRIGNASAPPLEGGAYDVVLSRHVLWALPDPASAVRHWLELLKPRGLLVLVEGRWASAGITAAEAEAIVRPVAAGVTVRHLPEPIYWGKVIGDERYLLTAHRSDSSADS